MFPRRKPEDSGLVKVLALDVDGHEIEGVSFRREGFRTLVREAVQVITKSSAVLSRQNHFHPQQSEGIVNALMKRKGWDTAVMKWKKSGSGASSGSGVTEIMNKKCPKKLTFDEAQAKYSAMIEKEHGAIRKFTFYPVSICFDSSQFWSSGAPIAGRRRRRRRVE